MTLQLQTELRVSDALQILKDLGGSATNQQIRELALQRFTPETVSQYLPRRLEQLLKWREAERHCQLRPGKTTYTITPQPVKSAEEIEREEKQALKKLVIFRPTKRTGAGHHCTICHERLTIFDDIRSIQRCDKSGRRYTVFTHKKCMR